MTLRPWKHFDAPWESCFSFLAVELDPWARELGRGHVYVCGCVSVLSHSIVSDSL